MLNYFEELYKAMTWLGEKDNTIFIGQAVGYEGTAMFKTLKNVPERKRVELPVFENTQMGISCGLGLSGLVPISIFPRWNFLLCGMDGLINHLDKYPILSDYQPHVIIRVGIGSVVPLDPQAQHRGDFTEPIRQMCQTIKVKKLDKPEDILESYMEAYQTPGVHLLCEVSDFFDESFRINYTKLKNNLSH